MHSYHSPADLEPLSRTDPDLWREIYGYMQVCLYDDDEVDLSFRVASEEDLPEIEALGTPEETATITLQYDDHSRTILNTGVLSVPYQR